MQEETKQARRERQNKAYQKMLREIRKSVREMWARKVKVDANQSDSKLEDIAIQDQANRDSEWYNYMTATPKFVPAPRIKWSAGLYNMFRQLAP